MAHYENKTRENKEKNGNLARTFLKMLSNCCVLTTELHYPTLLGCYSCCCYVLDQSVPGWYSSPLNFVCVWEKNWVACRFSQTRSCSCRCQLLLLLLFFLLVLVLLYRNVLFFFFFIVVDDGWWVCCFMMWLIVACRWCDLTYSYVCTPLFWICLYLTDTSVDH